MMEHGKLRLDESGVLTTDTRGEGFVPWLKALGADSEKFFYWVMAQRDQAREAQSDKLVAAGKKANYKPMFDRDSRNKLFSWTGKSSKSGKSWGELNKEFQAFNNSVLLTL